VFEVNAFCPGDSSTSHAANETTYRLI
jgi:hypothetical protein